MGKINWGRVLLGGLLAGLVANGIGFASWYLFLKARWAPAMEALGRPIQETTWAFDRGDLFILYLIAGILAIWLYAAIRPRYGPGPKTAAAAGFALWLIGGLIPTIGWGSFLQFPRGLLATDAIVGLITWVVATLIGAWPYKE